MNKNDVKRDVKRLQKAVNDDKNGKNDKKIYKSKFTFDEWHYAEIKHNGKLKFIKYRTDKNGIIESEIVDNASIPDPDNEDDAITVLPAPQIAQTKSDRALQETQNEAVKFPPEPIDYHNEYELYVEIKAFIHEFMELKPEDEIILALYVMKASLFDALKDTSFPFIHVLAPYGKGKSRLLTIMCEITPYGFYSVDIKSAALKRVSDLYGVVLFVDEKGSMDNELAAIINGKFNANTLILNANNEIQQGFSAIIGYRIYGPLMMAGRSPFKDDAIESKSFQINLDFELNRADVPRKIKGRLLDDFREIGLKIRGQLLNFRIKWHDRINEIEEGQFLKLYEDHTEPRLFEVISFFEDLIEIIPKIKPEIGQVLKSQIIRNVEVASQTPNGIIANEVLSLMQSEEETGEYKVNGKNYRGIYLTGIYEELGKEYSKQSGKILSTIGLRTDRPRITKTRNGTDGNPQNYTKRYSMVRIPDEKKIRELKLRYDPEFVIANLFSLEQGSNAILDDEDDEDDDIGSPPSINDGKNNNGDSKLKDGHSKMSEKKIPPLPNDSPHRPDSPEFIRDNVNHDVRSVNYISEEEGNQIKDSLLNQGIHLNASETGISTYGDKFNIAVPVNFYRQNSEKVDQAMLGFGFKKGNTGGLQNVFFYRPIKEVSR